MLLALFSFTSCNGDDEATEPSKQHTSHTIEKGKCTECGIDVFDELVKLVKGKTYTSNSGTTLQDTFGKSVSEDEEYQIRYIGESSVTGQDHFEIVAFDNEGRYVLIVRRGGVKSGIYEWSYHGKKVFQDINGSVDPTLLPSNSALKLGTYGSFYDSEDDAKSEMMYINKYGKAIQKTLVPLLKTSTNNLTPADYGFINY